jgi:carbon starvation protein CstA
MITFFVSIALLVGGYFIYGRVVEKIFGADNTRSTPAYTCQDGVDYVPMSSWRIFLIQFLNIAGLGPVFGAIMGAVYGPAAFLWIVLGCIFGGAVHDYLAGMISLRHNGLNLPELAGKYLGKPAMQILRVFTVVLLMLVGAVFIAGPSRLLAGIPWGSTLNIFSWAGRYEFWCAAVFVYYILATLLPIDKIIGKIYPFFGAALLFMAIGVGCMLVLHSAAIPEVTLSNLHNHHPDAQHFPIFPMLFISIACGAVSGFHATQSPLMARCLRNEKQGRRIFYGAMIAEGIVALIWAAAASSFFGSVGGLQNFLAENNQNAAAVVKLITRSWLGATGGLIAVIGVIVAPITSGDTAFRSARLIIAEFLSLKQKPLWNRIWIAIPLFVTGFILLQINFDILWRYFAWANQTLAAVTLWVITKYLAEQKKCYLISLFPALFMTMVVSVYISVAPEGFSLPMTAGYTTGSVITLAALALFVWWKRGYDTTRVLK